MLDIKAFNHSLKSIWFKKYLENENNGKWKLFFLLLSRKNTEAKESSQVI